MTEATTNSNVPPKSETRTVGELARDVLQLTKLQVASFRFELRRWLRELVWPSVVLVTAGVVALSCLPVLMLSAAYGLAESGLLPLSRSLLVVVCCSAAIAGVCGFAAWRRVCASTAPLGRFRREWIRSLHRVRELLREGRTPLQSSDSTSLPIKSELREQNNQTLQ
jgi:hypothetical protein